MPIKYVPFIPEPIEGQAVLGNFNRILKYRGADETSMILNRGMPLYDMLNVEKVGENTGGNMVIRGECVSACAYLKERGIEVDLVYIDPPFASGADYAKKIYVRRNPKVAEAIAKAEEELNIEEMKAFEEKMYGDVWEKEKYLNWMYENLMAIKSVMSETSSIYVHLDWHVVHYVKVLMDEIFGEDNFKNEIIWCYRGMAVATEHYTRRHDNILFYKKGDANIFNWQDITENLEESTVKKYSNVEKKTGRRFRLHGRNIQGSPIQNNTDIGINSIQITRDRLKADGAEFNMLEIKDGVSLYRNPVQTMDKIKSLIPGLKNEKSLDLFWEGAISDSKWGTIPVYVPNLMDSSTKLLDIVLINRIIHQAIPELEPNIKKVIIYYIDITDKDEVEKFIADDDSTTVKIELRDLKTILDDVVVDDYAEFYSKENYEDLFGGYLVTISKFASDRVMQKITEFNHKSFLNCTDKKPYKPIEISEDGLELIEYLSLDCTAVQGEWHSDSEVKIDKNGFVIKNGIKTKTFWDSTISCQKQPRRLKIRNICGDETIWNFE